MSVRPPRHNTTPRMSIVLGIHNCNYQFSLCIPQLNQRMIEDFINRYLATVVDAFSTEQVSVDFEN